MKSFTLFLLFTLVSSIVYASETTLIQQRDIKKIIRLDINSSINPATYSYLKAGFKEAHENEYQAILVTMNTPGGLVSTTKDILTLFGDSDLPVIIWIRPEGASATSAGAIISSGAHLLYMAEGTNIGAATPIEMSGDIKQSDARSKSINDLVALVQSLAQARGRNAELFAQMIEKASSFKSIEAKEKSLIDGIANSTQDIKDLSQHKTVKIKGNSVKLNFIDSQIISYGMDLGQKLLDILANPSTAYILFIMGAGLIYLELQAPGGFIAGSIGAVSLVLAGIGFQVLPLNFGALGLIVLSFVLLIMEIYITSFGILTLAGLAALISGSLFLFRTNDAYLHLSHTVIASTVAAVVAFVLLIAYVIIRDRKNGHLEEFNSMKSKEGVVLEKLNDNFYHIRVAGEVWRATCQENLAMGSTVKVIAEDSDKMILTIQSKA